jgi:transglutaminase-like putative cysteine protease
MLCLVTAACLAGASAAVMAARYAVLGEDVARPSGPGTWRVTLVIRGTSEGSARVWGPAPSSLSRQMLLEEKYTGSGITPRPVDERSALRRRSVWAGNGGVGEAFEARAEIVVALRLGRAAGQGKAASAEGAAPEPGEHLGDEPLIEASHPEVRSLAQALAGERVTTLEAARAYFDLVEKGVRAEPELDGSASALACLRRRAGGREARARLLTALLRGRGIPARVVKGLALAKGAEQSPHAWVEAHIDGHWVPMCPYHGAFGKLPSSYLALGHGDRPLVTARRVSGLQYAFTAEKLASGEQGSHDSKLKRAFKSISLFRLPPADRKLVEVLLLLPIAALIICVFRNLIGMTSFGLFTPALIGIAFHEVESWPGVVIFLTILLAGWAMRRILDGYHLLQVPRVALLLTLISCTLAVLVTASSLFGLTTTRYVSLFPLVILTGMVERFWTAEAEDGTASSLATLTQTMLISAVIALVAGRPWLMRVLFCFPEALGLVMACMVLIGRYTGYRLVELWRFRCFLGGRDEEPLGYTTAGA